MDEAVELFYFTDPMCSWCYGFGPELQKLLDSHPTKFSLTIIPGGLRPDETQPMSGQMAREIGTHWKHVQKASGLNFYYNFFNDNPAFVYDTTPACKAVVTVSLIQPELTFVYLKELQNRFYAKGENPTRMETFLKAASSTGVLETNFQKQWELDQSELETRRGFSMAAELGIRGYPTLCLRVENRLMLIAHGFLPITELTERTDALLENINKNKMTLASEKKTNNTSSGDACEVNPDGISNC